jgi:hypothetical protein
MEGIKYFAKQPLTAFIIKNLISLYAKIQIGMINGIDLLKHLEYSFIILCLLSRFDTSMIFGRQNEK